MTGGFPKLDGCGAMAKSGALNDEIFRARQIATGCVDSEREEMGWQQRT